MKLNKYVLTTTMIPALVMTSYLASGLAQAATTTYVLSNHPQSGGPPNPGTVSNFGLRLDGLLTGNPDETYLFDFDHASSNMLLTYDDVANTITISGTAYGYENNNSDGSIVAGTDTLWDISFTYTNAVSDATSPGFDDITVGAGGSGHVDSGTISSSFGTFDLRDHYAAAPIDGTFLFGDDPLVSQGTGLLTGWGWVDYCPENQCPDESNWFGSDMNSPEGPYPWTADWLFEATVIPVPAAVWLFGSGLIGLIAVARRKK
jgi:hypothetical protein